MSQQYEIEIKTLLGHKDNADKLKSQIESKGGHLINKGRQLNHYFILNDPKRFKDEISSLIPEDKKISFERILTEGKNFSVRTRDTEKKVILVIKASIGSDTSSNGVSRIEFEVDLNMTLDELDELDEKLISAGLEYQAKWSREREEFKLGNMNVCIDRNAGYVYLAEFESVIDDPSKEKETKDELYSVMKEFGVEELPQDRLERMFDFYNNNWRDYYGTENIFVIN